MTNFDIWLLVLCVFGLLVALGATSGVGQRAALGLRASGLRAGRDRHRASRAPGLLHLDPAASPLDATILREAARITLAIAVTGAAMRLPAYWLRLNWRGLGVSLVPGMVLMWGAGSAVAAVTLGLPLLPSLLLGAAIAPTDPVLSAPILTGRLAKRAVPEDLRDAMTAESGINDGLGTAVRHAADPVDAASPRYSRPGLGVAGYWRGRSAAACWWGLPQGGVRHAAWTGPVAAPMRRARRC